MSRAERPRLSVVRPETPQPAPIVVDAAIYREMDIGLASERLHAAYIRLAAIPRFPELADYRAGRLQAFEEAVNVMKDALRDE